MKEEIKFGDLMALLISVIYADSAYDIWDLCIAIGMEYL